MTSPSCASGTDRVAEVARRLAGVDIIVNVQGDEPEIAGESIDLAIRLLERGPGGRDVHAGHADPQPAPVGGPGLRESGVRLPRPGHLLQPQPDPLSPEWDDALLAAEPPHFYQHVGLYAYRRDFLLAIGCRCRRPGLEKIEKLEQLRVLAGRLFDPGRGGREETFGIDTPDDYRALSSGEKSRCDRLEGQS